MPLPALHCRPVQAVVKMVMASDLSLRGRFAPVAISQYPVGSWGSYRRNRSCLPEIATAPSGPRNDQSGYLKPWNPCQRNRNCLWRSLSAATFSLARWAYAGTPLQMQLACTLYRCPCKHNTERSAHRKDLFRTKFENAFSSAASCCSPRSSAALPPCCRPSCRSPGMALQPTAASCRSSTCMQSTRLSRTAARWAERR